jgi:hypothetical protein
VTHVFCRCTAEISTSNYLNLLLSGITNIFTLIVNITLNKKYWQEVNKMTTNLYIGDHVFNLEFLVFGYKIYDQAYFDLNLALANLTYRYKQ